MIGSEAFGSAPFSGSISGVPDYAEMLQSSRELLVYTVELHLRDTVYNTETILFLANTEWATKPDEVPASRSFRGVLSQPLNFRRSVIGERVGINHDAGGGTIVFLNTDGYYDGYIDKYAADGRDVIVRVGRQSDLFADHLIIFNGSASDWSANRDSVTVSIRDKSFKLDVPTQPLIYAGTGGSEGGSDLKGKRKPRCFGVVGGTPLTTIDDALLTYQVHAGRVNSIAPVYDRGVTLSLLYDWGTYASLAANAVSPGYYSTCLAEGFLGLGADPAGILLATVNEGTVERRIGNVVQDLLLQENTGLTVDDIDFGSLAAIDLRAEAIDYFVDPGDSSTVRETIDRLAAGIGGWGGFNRQGIYKMGILEPPAGLAYTSVFNYDDGDLIDFNKDRLPSGVWPPPWRWRVAHARAYTTFDDFAGSVDATTRTFYAEPYRLAEKSDTDVLEDHPLSVDPPPVESYYRDLDDADREAQRLLTLYSSGYHIYRFTTSRRGLLLDIGDTITITHPRFGFESGAIATVVEIDDHIDLAFGSGVEEIEISVLAKGFMFTDARFDLDFTRNLGWNGTINTAKNMVVCSRGHSMIMSYAEDLNGYWHGFPPNTPRITNKGLLIEKATTNRIRNNSLFAAFAYPPILNPPTAPLGLPSTWSVTGSELSDGVTWSVHAVGTDDGFGRDYIDLRFSGTSTANSATTLNLETLTGANVNPNAAHVLSFWASRIGGTLANINSILSMVTQYNAASVYLQNSTVLFDLTTAPVRFVHNFTTASTTVYARPALQISYNVGPIDVIFRLAWPQLEQGAFATSPIRTALDDNITRSADVVTVPNVSWVNSQVGTMYAESTSHPSSPAASVFYIARGSNEAQDIIHGPVGTTAVVTEANFAVAVYLTHVVAKATTKTAYAYQANNFGVAFEGVPQEQLYQGVPSLANCQVTLGGGSPSTFNGYISRVAYWQARLATNKLVDLTR